MRTVSFSSIQAQRLQTPASESRFLICPSTFRCSCLLIGSVPFSDTLIDEHTWLMEEWVFHLNVSGLLNPIKRSKIGSKMEKQEQARVVYLQGTHLNAWETKEEGLHESEMRFFPQANYMMTKYSKWKRQICFRKGKYRWVTLLNIYAPSRSDISFYQKITNIMITETKYLIMSDWLRFK